MGKPQWVSVGPTCLERQIDEGSRVPKGNDKLFANGDLTAFCHMLRDVICESPRAYTICGARYRRSSVGAIAVEDGYSCVETAATTEPTPEQ